jgi:hypothetical protein
MTIRIASELIHQHVPGDGVRAFIVSSRDGLLSSGKAHNQTAPMNVETLMVEAGDTIDFVVDIGDVLNTDQFLWQCSLTPGGTSAAQGPWNSEADFPKNTTQELSPLEQLAQVLLCSNEFLFVD